MSCNGRVKELVNEFNAYRGSFKPVNVGVALEGQNPPVQSP